MQKKQSPVKSQILSEQKSYQGKWLGISTIKYAIGDKIISGYESVYRPQRKQKGFSVDGAQMIPIIRRSNQESELVFIANYRPSIDSFSIEFPAGLIQDQNMEQNAMRQLQEQTGFVPQKILKQPMLPMHCDPWKSNQCGLLYIGLINGDDPNHQRHQKLQKDENIRVFKLKLNKGLCESLSKYALQNNYRIHIKVWAFCVGYSMINYLEL